MTISCFTNYSKRKYQVSKSSGWTEQLCVPVATIWKRLIIASNGFLTTKTHLFASSISLPAHSGKCDLTIQTQSSKMPSALRPISSKSLFSFQKGEQSDPVRTPDIVSIKDLRRVLPDQGYEQSSTFSNTLSYSSFGVEISFALA